VARGRISPRRAKIHYAYTVEETARLFGVCRNTVRNWQKAGLKSIDDRRPTLFKGGQVRAFLEGRRAAAKSPCPPGTLYCLKCRAPRSPALGMVDYVARDEGPGDLRALCESCGTEMHRRARQGAIGEILPGVEVRIVRAAPRISECPNPSPNCALRLDELT
jgi:hypothetical protein